MKTFLLTMMLFAQTATGVQIRVLNSAQETIPQLHLRLMTYTYAENGQVYLRESQDCYTDSDGACTLLLEKPNRDGMQRGTLEIESYGKRDLIWPGGMLELVIPLEQIGFGREAAPYEFQAEDGGVAVIERPFPLFALLMILLLGFLLWSVFQASRSQKENA